MGIGKKVADKEQIIVKKDKEINQHLTTIRKLEVNVTVKDHLTIKYKEKIKNLAIIRVDLEKINQEETSLINKLGKGSSVKPKKYKKKKSQKQSNK
jgi:hypothetical protein